MEPREKSHEKMSEIHRNPMFEHLPYIHSGPLPASKVVFFLAMVMGHGIPWEVHHGRCLHLDGGLEILQRRSGLSKLLAAEVDAIKDMLMEHQEMRMVHVPCSNRQHLKTVPPQNKLPCCV